MWHWDEGGVGGGAGRGDTVRRQATHSYLHVPGEGVDQVQRHPLIRVSMFDYTKVNAVVAAYKYSISYSAIITTSEEHQMDIRKD